MPFNRNRDMLAVESKLKPDPAPQTARGPNPQGSKAYTPAEAQSRRSSAAIAQPDTEPTYLCLYVPIDCWFMSSCVH